MSQTDRDDVVTVRLTRDEIFAARGALSVVEDIRDVVPEQARKHGVQFEAKSAAYERADRELEDALENQVPGFERDVGLSMEEQRAIQDAVVTVDKLMGVPEGQTLLARVGLAPEEGERERLRSVLSKILDERSGSITKRQ